MRFEMGGLTTAWVGAVMSAEKFALWMAGMASAVTILVGLIRLYWDWRREARSHQHDKRNDRSEDWGGDE